MLKTRQGRIRYTETLEELLRNGTNRMPESQHDRKPGDGLIKLDNISKLLFYKCIKKNEIIQGRFFFN